MNTLKYIGIDVHQATSVFAIRDHQGKLIGEAVLETKPAAIIDFLKGQRGTVWVTFEEGTYANWLYDVIHPHVAKLLVCDPRKNKLDGNKTDKIDARRLAELLRLNALKAVYHGQDSTRVMNRLKAIFRGRGIPCRGTSIYLPENRKEWLEKLKDNGAQLRAERLLEQLESLAPLCLEAERDLVRESRKHQSYKILRGESQA